MIRTGGSTRTGPSRALALLLTVIMFSLVVPLSAMGTSVPPPEPDAVIAGRVTDEVTGDPIEGIKVKFYWDSALDGGDYVYTYTNGDGVFEKELEPGNYYIFFWDPDYSDGAYANEYYDDVQSSGEATRLAFNGVDSILGVNAQLTPLEEGIKGTVTIEETTEGTTDLQITETPDLTPVEGIKVKLYKDYSAAEGTSLNPYVGWSEIAYAYTDELGEYTFFGLSAGTYRVGTYDPEDRYFAEFYDNVPDLEDGTDISYDGTATVSGIDFILGEKPEELWDYDRFTTAIEINEAAYPGWEGIDTIVIASGDDRASADPLAAAGLCWAYDAPLFIVSAKGPPHEVKEAIIEIIEVNGPIDMIVAGGTVSVPDWVANLIEDYCEGQVEGPYAGQDTITGELDKSGVTETWRRIAGKDRFETAAMIVDEMAVCGKPLSTDALVANGGDYASFFDALALSPIARQAGIPVLLVTTDGVPGSTARVIRDYGITDLYIAGGDKAVGPKARAELSELATIAAIWAGDDRYGTARAIAEGAIGMGWLSADAVGIAANLPDALTGSGIVGMRNGVLLLVRKDYLPLPTSYFLNNNKDVIKECYIFGGPAAIEEVPRDGVEDKLW